MNSVLFELFIRDSVIVGSYGDVDSVIAIDLSSVVVVVVVVVVDDVTV